MLDTKPRDDYRDTHTKRPAPKQRTVWMRLHREGRKRLAKLLLIQEVSHRELASAVGLRSHGMIGHLLAGRRNGVRPDVAVAIARYFGVEVSDLFTTELPSKSRQAGRAA